MADKAIIDGFAFSDDADVSLASAEIEKIKYIASRMNMNNPKGVLAVYDKRSDIIYKSVKSSKRRARREDKRAA